MTGELNLSLLRSAAVIVLDPPAKSLISELGNKITDWENLIQQAESYGLSTLLLSHLGSCAISIPRSHEISLKALCARHQRSNRERTLALIEILDKFAENNIDSVLLKGMALIQTLYTEQYQRPMGDIDILVRGKHALLAQQILRDLGYAANDRKQGYLYDHHHLPIATRVINGLTIQVEVHHNALSGDVKESMTYEPVGERKIDITVNGRPAATMGHEDMLHHLCQHAFEPCDKIKLGAVADIYGYATKFNEDIDWGKLKADHFLVINTLRCLHFLTPLPQVLETRVGVPQCSPQSGVGEGFQPLSVTLGSSKTLSWKIRKIFFCSNWWLAVFYQTPPEKSLLPVKLVRHPLRVGFWFYRRLMAKLRTHIN